MFPIKKIVYGGGLLLAAAGLFGCVSMTQKTPYSAFKHIDGLVAFWDFSEGPGVPKCSQGKDRYELTEYGEPIPVVGEGPWSGRSVQLNGASYLSLPYEKTGALDLKDNQVTVLAWVKKESSQIGFVGGMWNEYQEGGKRQYGLFISLPHYNGADQVCGHISKTGKPTPPFPYSIDYSASRQTVPLGQWCCAAFTYDGKYIRSYLDGVFEPREPELISHTKGFPGYPEGLVQSKNPYYYPDGMGSNGSDFTVGAVMVKSGMGNFFVGKIGGLAVFNRALSPEEIARISKIRKN